ncbi:Phosphatidylinositol N-acetyglucosaminlytransferase subunit P-related [Striga hermonthica]|uniref:Phosphatidylinositol N-acetyglucosaminlytransferase subunit P-related n=1 Tax=Striga hermonthica TaxID=68872 RepID=A0A9N7MIJ3_STRHE|nr:Phosphatidylinositol N-acetyglucosaminlytransferase subunit P-related [Striga hermonthica]
MERRSTRISELRQKQELSIMWRLLNATESCQDQPCGKSISNRRPSSKRITARPRKIDQLTSFDAECRRIRIRNEAELGNVKADDEYMPSETYETIYQIIEQHQCEKVDPQLINLLVKAHNRVKEKSRKAHHLSSCYLSDAANLFHQLLPTSSKMSLDSVTLAAILRTVCVHNHREESIHTSAKAFVDRMFIHRKLISKGMVYPRSKSSSNAFEIPDSDKDLFGGLFLDTESLLQRPFKNSKYPQIEKNTLKSVLDGKELERLDSTSSSEKPGSLFIARNGKMDTNPQSKSTETNFVEQPSDRIVILKPAPQKSAKQSEYVNCHCSSLQSQKKFGKFPEAKPKSFSFREMKRKLKHAFGGTKKESSKIQNFGSKGNLDFPTEGTLPGQQEFDVILEAKKHLSARLKKVNATETVTDKKSPKTLGRILSSPERDFRAIGPRRGSPHDSDFDQMIFNPYNGSARVGEIISEMPKGKRGVCLSPSRHYSEVTSCGFVFENRILQIMDTKTGFSPTPSTDDNSSSIDDINSNANTIKLQGEHQSPVSVLDPFFTEDANSPPSTTLQSGQFSGHQCKPRRLDFDQCSFDSSRHDPPNSCMQEQDHLSQYVHSVLEASCLDWDQLSEIASPHEEILDSFLFHEVEFSSVDGYFDLKLLFDRINEILVEIYEFHFCSPSWPSFVKPKIKPWPLAELVHDEVMKGAEFFLLPRTERRTLDQLVSKDVAKCGSWIDIRVDTEELVNEISDECVEECTLDVLLEFYT